MKMTPGHERSRARQDSAWVRVPLVLAAAATAVTLAGCSSSKPAYCTDRTNLENSVKGLTSSGVSGGSRGRNGGGSPGRRFFQHHRGHALSYGHRAVKADVPLGADKAQRAAGSAALVFPAGDAPGLDLVDAAGVQRRLDNPFMRGMPHPGGIDAQLPVHR